MAKATHRRLAAWIFFSIFVLFLMVTFFFSKNLDPYQRSTLNLFRALTAGFAAYFFIGSIKIVTESTLLKFGKVAIQTGGGFALFVLVFFVGLREVDVGMTGPEVIELVETVMERSRLEREAFDQEREGLKKQLEDALQRVAASEEPDAGKALQTLRKSGDSEKLLDFLETDAERSTDDVIERDREIAAVAYLTGEIARAEKAIDRILLSNPDDLEALNRKGHVQRLQGNLEGASISYTKILELSVEQGDRLKEAAASCSLGVICAVRGESDKAEEFCLKSLAIYEELGHKVGMAPGCANLGILYETRGELDKAEEFWIRSRDRYLEIGMPHEVEEVQGWLDELEGEK